MASNKPTDLNIPFGNIKIKQEPGTSAPTNTAGSTARLKSFTNYRDLNMVGVKTERPTRRIIAPNIANYQRRKKEDAPVVVKQETTKTPRGRGRERNRGQGERGRGRGKQETISLGTATEAPSLSGSRRSAYRGDGGSGGGGGGGGSGAGERESRATIDRPVLDLNRAVDKEGDEEVLKALYRDDFIDDGDDTIAGDSPITLPVLPYVQQIKSDVSIPNKSEITETTEEIDQKPIILENGNAVMPKKKIIKKKTTVQSETQNEDLSVKPANVFEINNTSQSSDFILFILPDSLPGFPQNDDDIDDKKPNTESTTSKNNEADNPKDKYCKLGSLNEGLVGKIQIHKSGKAYLKLGDNYLAIDVGSRRCYRQDLIAAKLEEDKKDLINLGPVSNTLICSPSWERMLANL